MKDVDIEESLFIFTATGNAKFAKIIQNHVVKDSKLNLVRNLKMRRNNETSEDQRMEEVAVLPEGQGNTPLDQNLQMFNDKSRLGELIRFRKRTACVYMDCRGRQRRNHS